MQSKSAKTPCADYREARGGACGGWGNKKNIIRYNSLIPLNVVIIYFYIRIVLMLKQVLNSSAIYEINNKYIYESLLIMDNGDCYR